MLTETSWILGLLTCRSAHLQSHQSSDQDRHVKLSGDTFGDRRVAGLQGQRSDVAKADGGQRCQAEVAENRKKVLKLGRLAGVCGHDAGKGFRMPLKYNCVQKSPAKAEQQVNRDRHADGFTGHLSLL